MGIGNELFRLLTNLGEKLTKEEAKALMKELASRRTRRASWSSNLSWRGCALLRSKRLPVLSYLYITIQYSPTIQYKTAMEPCIPAQKSPWGHLAAEIAICRQFLRLLSCA